MFSARCGDAAGEFTHVDAVIRLTVEAICDEWKIERTLDRPDPFMLIRWQDLGRIPDRYPADWDCRIRRNHRADMYNAVDAYLSAATDLSFVEDRDASCEKDLIFYGAAGQR